MNPLSPRMFIPAAIWLIFTLTPPMLWGQIAGVRVEATLSGFQEVPPILSDGRGEFSAIIHNNSITFQLSYSGLSSPVLFAHVHLGQRGVNGGIVFFLCGGDSKPDCPASGTITGKINEADVIAVPAQGVEAGDLAGVIRAILRGVTYANVHTTNFPAGEIRGQLRVEDD